MSRIALTVYGDSLSLPRAQDGISCFDTYPEMLRNILQSRDPASRVAVLNRSRGGASIAALYGQFIEDSVYIGAEEGRVLVIQCGIVDCAPRPVPPSVKSGIARLPKALRWMTARFLHYARPLLLASGFSWQNTEQAAFSDMLSQWVARANKCADRVYVINIAPTTARMDRHSPGLSASIAEYNATIAQVVASARSVHARLIDVHGAIKANAAVGEDFVSARDGHHLTRAGHRLYADLIAAAEPRDRPA